MWEEICGDCGANQQVLAEEYREGLRSQQEKAEERRKQGDLKAARIIAAIVRDEPDARFQHLAGWARQFLVSLDEEYDQMFKELPGYLERALHYETESDYREAIETLQQIPAWLRNEPLAGHPVTASELLTQLTAKQAEIERLEKLIMERVQTRELTGLMLEVESILALHPGHPDMLNVKQQLVHWEGKRRESRDQFYSQAQQYFADHDYERCLGELAMIETSLVTSEVEDLRDRTEAACDRLERLDKMISSAIQEKVFSGLLKPVEEYLELKPGSAGMEKLHQTLVEREKENAARVSEILKVAENLRKECRFDEAASLLQDQPPELEMPELISLRKDSLSVSDTRTVALDAIQNAMQTGNFSSGLADAEQYYELQEVRSFRDSFFLAQHKACSEALEQDQELRAVVARRWAKARKIILIASSLLAMGVLVIVSMRISSAVRQARISELIENQHWDEVLVLDADHVQALIGRARDGLASGTADIEEVFTDLERAERLDPEAVGMLEVKGLAHLERASLRAQRDQVDAAEIDWRVAVVLKTDEVHQLPVRQALVEAYLRRAELSLEKGEANAVSADCGRAEELGSRASDLVGLRLEAYQLRAERLVAVGDMEAAQATLEAALALGKRQPRLMQAIEALHIALGQKALANNDLVVARRELMVALEISRPETGSSSPEKSTKSRELLAFEGHASQVWDLAFSPDGKQIATASEDQMVKVWNATRGRRLLVFEGHTGTVWSIAFSPDGQQLISGGGTDKKAGEIKLWDLATGKLLFTKQEHALAVQGVAFRSDGKQVASASWDSTIQLWDVASGEKQHTLIGHSGVVQGVAFSPDGKRIASARGDRTVRVWDDSNGELLRTLNGHDLRVSSVVFSPDGMHLASASADKTVRLWEATTGKQLQELTGHTDAVSHVAFSPDGKRLASASTDKTIRLWDAATGKRLLTIGPGSREFQRVSFGPTGKRLASASHDGKIQVWDISDLLVTDNHQS
ncbi:MAG: WD40 repeat domain-containing protein, partial [Pirellulaceae bacterium]